MAIIVALTVVDYGLIAPFVVAITVIELVAVIVVERVASVVVIKQLVAFVLPLLVVVALVEHGRWCGRQGEHLFA